MRIIAWADRSSTFGYDAQCDLTSLQREHRRRRNDVVGHRRSPHLAQLRPQQTSSAAGSLPA
jgi:hypothetical protein